MVDTFDGTTLREQRSVCGHKTNIRLFYSSSFGSCPRVRRPFILSRSRSRYLVTPVPDSQGHPPPPPVPSASIAVYIRNLSDTQHLAQFHAPRRRQDWDGCLKRLKPRLRRSRILARNFAQTFYAAVLASFLYVPQELAQERKRHVFFQIVFPNPLL